MTVDTTPETNARLRELISKAVQVTVKLTFPTTTSVQRNSIGNYRDGLEIRDLFTEVRTEFTDLLNPDTSKERLTELLPNINNYPYIYKIYIVETFGEAPIVFLSNGDGSQIEEQTQYVTVCVTCGSDSIVDSKYGTDDGWCDACEDFGDSQEITEQEYLKI